VFLHVTIHGEQRTAKDCNEKLLDVKEAAEFLRVKTDTLLLWLYTNKYPQLKSIKMEDIEGF
jgi:hypothetical protein